jgi:hypothetical protein
VDCEVADGEETGGGRGESRLGLEIGTHERLLWVTSVHYDPMTLALRRWALPFVALGVTAACGSANSHRLADGDDGGSSGAAADDASPEFGQGPAGSGSGGGVFGGAADSGASDSAGGVPVTSTSIDDCTTGAASGLSAASVKALLAGGSVGSMRLLYPYSQTVFPRGLIAPTIMWDGASADYVYVHLKSKVFEYKGCLKPTATGQILLPQDIWAAASAHTAGESDPFVLSLATIASGTVTGPISEPIVIAPATLKGSIYYNSYTSKLAAAASSSSSTSLFGGFGGGGGSGAVLRIVPGQNVTLFLGASGCTGCHSVSANGARMVADPLANTGFGGNGDGATYALTPQGASNPAPLVSNAPNATFVGLYPDGSLYIGNAHPANGGGPRSIGAAAGTTASLFETDTGNAVANANIAAGAMMSTFSPDGTRLAFTDDALGDGNGPGLATMAFDKATRTASAYQKVYQVTDSTTYPGWPFFLPDDGAIVFAIGNQKDFSGAGLGLGGLAGAATSDLYILDVASGTATLLGNAVGFASAAAVTAGKSYLPYSAADELHHNFYPTVSPVAAGGYFWIFFDSYRHYGNQGLQRQLWGTAISISPTGKYTVDASHPPFYVTGQELGTGNHRAFCALDPCLANGKACTGGQDCCGGFCTNGTCGQAASCSNIDDACSATQKCCDASLQCIGGFCSQVTSAPR